VNSVLLCSAIALVFGLGGFLIDWWSWGWSIPIALVVFVAAWIVIARRMGARLQPHLTAMQQQMQAGNVQGAMKTLESMLPMAKWVPMLRGQLLAQMGMLANMTGDQDRAIQLLEGASLRATDARLVLACILYKKGDSKRAFEILRLAAAVSKKHALLHNTYAWLLHKTERADEAQAVLAAFLKRDPNNAPSKDNLLRLQNRTRMTMQGFDMQWYALGLEQPPQTMGQMRRAPKGFREPPKQRGR
jgi:tetratricopeptide (TPR) repeat protein